LVGIAVGFLASLLVSKFSTSKAKVAKTKKTVDKVPAEQLSVD